MNHETPGLKNPPDKEPGRNREKLLALEGEGTFVFHGSPDAVNALQPRQAYNYNKETGQMEKDGAPAVFATPHADVAIFRALINTKGVTGESESSFGIKEGRLHFSATRNLLDQTSGKTGKIYVLDKRKFKDLEGMQCRSEEPIAPIEVIEVTTEDLPKDIKLIE
ncbi:MAG: hypothetical protein V1723_01400 [Candidatus Uhrbacteria bacterium]